MRTISGISTRISKQMGQAGLLPLALATLMLASCGGGDQHRAELDLDSLDGQWDTFIRMRYGAPGEEVVSWWDGKVFSVVPGEKPEALFGIIGHNIGQVLPAEDGTYQWVSREVAYYTDLKTGEILSHWDNPWTGERVKVVDVFNDPVNGANIRGRSPLSFKRGSDGTVMLQFDVPLEYPNPLQPQDYPESSSGQHVPRLRAFPVLFARRGPDVRRGLCAHVGRLDAHWPLAALDEDGQLRGPSGLCIGRRQTPQHRRFGSPRLGTHPRAASEIHARPH